MKLLNNHRATSLIVGLVIPILGLAFVVPIDARAAYLQEQKVTAPDGAGGDLGGRSVGITADGSRMIVGANHVEATDTGAAYVYVRSGTTWALEQKLTSDAPIADENFGQSVAIASDGSRVIVGGPDLSSATSGSAYVFSRSGTTWTLEQKITPSDGALGDGFGWSVAMTDDASRVSVGAPSKASVAGAVYVFSRSGVAWTEEQKLTASDAAASSNFGSGVAIASDGSRLVIGSAFAGADDKGAGYIFSRSGTVWTEEQKVTASDGAEFDSLGGEYQGGVAIDATGERVLLGSQYNNGVRGAVYAFSRSNTTWTEEQKLTASDADLSQIDFGVSVALSRDGITAIVGANGATSAFPPGAAYVFSRSGATWTETALITPSTNRFPDYFGTSVAIIDDYSRFVVGSTNIFAVVGESVVEQVGAAYVFFDESLAPAADPVSGGSSSLCTGELRVTVASDSSVSSLNLDAGVIQSGTLYPVACGTHTVSATPATQGMSVALSGDCTSGGSFSVERGQSRSCTVTVFSPTPSPTPTPTPEETPTPTPTPSGGTSTDLPEGSVISAPDSSDPDLYIVNASGYKRLFLNPVIFSFYGHLGGWSAVKNVTATVRDLFPTSGLFRNCETNDQKVYAVEITGEDTGMLHHINMTGSQALSEDPAFFSKVFCVNSNEFNWYPLSPVPYTALGQVPSYRR